MAVNIVLSIVVVLYLWSARQLYATTLRIYRMPISFIPGAVKAIQHRVFVAGILSLGLVYRIWG